MRFTWVCKKSLISQENCCYPTVRVFKFSPIYTGIENRWNVFHFLINYAFYFHVVIEHEFLLILNFIRPPVEGLFINVSMLFQKRLSYPRQVKNKIYKTRGTIPFEFRDTSKQAMKDKVNKTIFSITWDLQKYGYIYNLRQKQSKCNSINT